MTVEGTDSSNQYLTRQNFLRFYRYLTAIGLVAVVAAVVASETIPSAITEPVIGCWLLATLFVFAHFGIKNTTHGV